MSPQRLAGTKLRGLSLPHHPHMLLCDAPLTNEGADHVTTRELIKYLRRQRGIRWDVLFFSNLLEDIRLLSALNAGVPALRILEPQTRCNYLSCFRPDELAARFSQNFRDSTMAANRARAISASLRSVTSSMPRRMRSWPPSGLSSLRALSSSARSPRPVSSCVISKSLKKLSRGMTSSSIRR